MAYGWKPYVPVAKRRANAAKKMQKLSKKGQKIEPVEPTGRTITHTFWGKAWANHLEQFSDYENRLPRGRTYVRNGSVCHLEISKGKIEAMVSGSTIYKINIEIASLPETKWQQLRNECSGKIGSMLELLQGQLSDQVMQIVTHRDHGLFPHPQEIKLKCNCPDWADLCKHLAAVLYGVAARLDQKPELLFQLRGVDHQQLISADLNLSDAMKGGKSKRQRLNEGDLSELFGVEFDEAPTPRPRSKKAPLSKKREIPPLSSPADASFTPTSASITQLRRRFGLNKSQFARLIGVSVATISKWERADMPLKLQMRHMAALQKVTGLTPEEAKQYAIDPSKLPVNSQAPLPDK